MRDPSTSQNSSLGSFSRDFATKITSTLWTSWSDDFVLAMRIHYIFSILCENLNNESLRVPLFGIWLRYPKSRLLTHVDEDVVIRFKHTTLNCIRRVFNGLERNHGRKSTAHFSNRSQEQTKHSTITQILKQSCHFSFHLPLHSTESKTSSAISLKKIV